MMICTAADLPARRTPSLLSLLKDGDMRSFTFRVVAAGEGEGASSAKTMCAKLVEDLRVLGWKVQRASFSETAELDSSDSVMEEANDGQ